MVGARAALGSRGAAGLSPRPSRDFIGTATSLPWDGEMQAGAARYLPGCCQGLRRLDQLLVLDAQGHTQCRHPRLWRGLHGVAGAGGGAEGTCWAQSGHSQLRRRHWALLAKGPSAPSLTSGMHSAQGEPVQTGSQKAEVGEIEDSRVTNLPTIVDPVGWPQQTLQSHRTLWID